MQRNRATRALHPSTRIVSENIPGGRLEGAGGSGTSEKNS
jgi:hypothetical protein